MSGLITVVVVLLTAFIITLIVELNLKIDVLIDALKFTRTRLIYKNMATREIDCLFKQMGIKP